MFKKKLADRPLSRKYGRKVEMHKNCKDLECSETVLRAQSALLSFPSSDQSVSVFGILGEYAAMFCWKLV